MLLVLRKKIFQKKNLIFYSGFKFSEVRQTVKVQISGTRTLIDNLDNGITAISITAKYTGFFDCFRTVINRESIWSLYAVCLVLNTLIPLVLFKTSSLND